MVSNKAPSFNTVKTAIINSSANKGMNRLSNYELYQAEVTLQARNMPDNWAIISSHTAKTFCVRKCIPLFEMLEAPT